VARVDEQGAVKQSVLREALGPMYSVSGVASLLGISEEEAEARAASHDLWGPTTADGFLVFPASQFSDDGAVLPGLKDVLDAFPTHVADCWTVAAWIAARHPDLGDRTVLEWLGEPAHDSDSTPLKLAQERAYVWSH
jgi:hypothetical protein